MFKASKVEKKQQQKIKNKSKREINLLINMQINLSSRRTSDHYLSLPLEQLSRFGRNHIVYILLK